MIGDWASGIGVIAYCVTAIIVLRWVYLAARAANTVSNQIAVTPGWAVGRFFLPILNLWRPFRGVAEIWRVSVDPVAPHRIQTPALLRWWWGLWLATSLFGPIGGTITDKPEFATRLGDRWSDIILFALDVPLVVLLVRIVTQVTARLHALLTQQVAALDEGHAS